MTEKVDKLDVKMPKQSRMKDWETKEGLKQITEWAKKGMIIEHIAANIGIAKSTFYMWRNESEAIEEAWMKGKTYADVKVLDSMFKAATGYHVDETVKVYDDVGTKVEERVTTKYVPPNGNMINLWVKNRMGGAFKDNQLTEAYRTKIEAETEHIKVKTKMLEVVSKDTNKLEALEALFKTIE